MWIWKRYKIGDKVLDARRFRFDYLFIILELLEHLFSRIDNSSLRYYFVSAFSDTLFRDA